MKDAQFISELLLVALEMKQHGFDQDHINECYAKYDDVDSEESDADIDVSEFNSSLNALKKLFVSLNNERGIIRKFSSTLQIFYTIWAAAILSPQHFSNIETARDKLHEFGGLLDEFRASEDKAQLVANSASGRFSEIAAFHESLQGASTDLAARQKRLAAFIGFMAKP
jgi:hypothetical protein